MLLSYPLWSSLLFWKLPRNFLASQPSLSKESTSRVECIPLHPTLLSSRLRMRSNWNRMMGICSKLRYKIVCFALPSSCKLDPWLSWRQCIWHQRLLAFLLRMKPSLRSRKRHEWRILALQSFDRRFPCWGWPCFHRSNAFWVSEKWLLRLDWLRRLQQLWQSRR